MHYKEFSRMTELHTFLALKTNFGIKSPYKMELHYIS